MEEWVAEIQKRALTGKPLISGGRSDKLGKISFDDLVFIPVQLAKLPVDYYREEISTETIIGKNSEKPLKLKIPILFGAISFGSVNKKVKIALAKASSILGTATNTGEGGMLPEERKHAKLLVAQYSTARFGVDEDYIKKADAIEIKIGQGAKPGCYTPDHEILTPKGFKPVSELKIGEQVWSVNPHTNELELAKVVKRYKYYYEGKLIHAKSRTVDFLVTPEHNLPIRLRSGKWKFIKAGDSMKRNEIRTQVKLGWKGKATKKRISIPKIEKKAPHQKEYESFPLSSWLKLCGWIIAEGYCGKNRIEISQTKPDYRLEISRLLRSMGINFSNNPTKLVIHSKQLNKFISRLFGKNSYERRICLLMKNLPKKELGILLKTLVKGDGYKRKGRYIYFTASKRLMSDIVEIALKLGMQPSVSKDERTYRIEMGKGRWHGLSSKVKKNSWQKKPTLQYENYEGFVYCPQLDKNHTLIVMRNGKICVNGNSGGLLPGEKVTEEIAKIRKVPMGKTVHSPPYHPDIKTPEDLRKKIEWIKEINGGKPVIIKLGAGDVENDIKFAVKANPDAIAIDGMEGGTGAAPRIMLDNFGIPTLAALVKARNTLDELKAKQDLLIGGGLNKGSDVAKALALGADAVFMGFAPLIAMGCIYCKLCHEGNCPVGITTQDENLIKKLDKDAVKKVVNFITACTEEVKMVAAACGKRNIHELDRKHLRSLSLIISKITGISLVGD